MQSELEKIISKIEDLTLEIEAHTMEMQKNISELRTLLLDAPKRLGSTFTQSNTIRISAFH